MKSATAEKVETNGDDKASYMDGLNHPEDILAAIRYRPRGDMVLIREVNLGMVGRIATGDRSIEGKDYRVIRVGPEVEDIKAGMSIWIIGKQGAEWAMLPSVPSECGRGLFILRAVNIPLIEVKPKEE